MTTPQPTEKDKRDARILWRSLEVNEHQACIENGGYCEAIETISKFIAAQRLETLKSEIVTEFVKRACENHDRRCRECDAKMFDYCDFLKAHKAFNALLAKLEPKEDKSK